MLKYSNYIILDEEGEEEAARRLNLEVTVMGMPSMPFLLLLDDPDAVEQQIREEMGSTDEPCEDDEEG